jgi:hypothetical protein
MREKRIILILTISLVYANVPILAAETTIIQVHLFKGAWTEGHPGLINFAEPRAVGHGGISLHVGVEIGREFEPEFERRRRFAG